MVLFTSVSANSVSTVIEIHKMDSTTRKEVGTVASLWLLRWQTATKPPGSARYTGKRPSIASVAQESVSLAITVSPSRRATAWSRG
jgi:hypothetical protein